MAIKRKTSRTKTATTSRKTTLVCAAASACAAAPVKIALLGFGTVGSSVARVLASSKLSDIELTHIFNRNVERKRASDAAKCVPESVVRSSAPARRLWWSWWADSIQPRAG